MQMYLNHNIINISFRKWLINAAEMNFDYDNFIYLFIYYFTSSTLIFLVWLKITNEEKKMFLWDPLFVLSEKCKKKV